MANGRDDRDALSMKKAELPLTYMLVLAEPVRVKKTCGTVPHNYHVYCTVNSYVKYMYLVLSPHIASAALMDVDFPVSDTPMATTMGQRDALVELKVL